MTTEREILEKHVRRKNEKGEIVTYSTIVSEKVLNRSNPTIFKLIKDMIGKELRVEWLESETGHKHEALFIKTDPETELKDLYKLQIAESIRTRMMIQSFMNGRVSKAKRAYKWQSLEDYMKERNKENIKEEGKV